MKHKHISPYCLLNFIVFYCLVLPVAMAQVQNITDSLGRKIQIKDTPKHVICSGAGSLRLLTYLQAQDRIVAVDSIEIRNDFFDVRPYALANPQFRKLPIFGEYRGNDNPERIVSLDPQPEVIFKTFSTMGYNPQELQSKIRIPVIALSYGDLSNYKSSLYQSIHIMGTILNTNHRAMQITSFFDQLIADLNQRCQGIKQRPLCYVGGIAFKGIQNFQSTEPLYPPFKYTHTKNIACDTIGKHLSHSYIAKEKLVEWNPDYIFVDLASLAANIEANALYELKNDPVYQNLDAVKNGKVYGVLPYNGYAQNFGSTMANAWFVGKLLYPDRFQDIDPIKKADEIYHFLFGKSVFKQMNKKLHSLVFQRVVKE